VSERKAERGAVTVIVLAAMVAVLGLGAIVIDGGLLYHEQAKLQTAVDAVALAGAQALPLGHVAARNAAESVALNNGLSLDELQLGVDAAGAAVTASAARQVALGLARILDHHQATVGARAEARLSGLTGLQGVAPLGVIWQNFVFGQLYDIKMGAGSGGGGNYGALALGGTGSANYRENLRSGYPGWLHVGDTVLTEPGNMSGPTKQAIDERLAACRDGCTFTRHTADCPRIMLVAVIPGLPNGRGEVTILGFAAFFVEGVTGQGNDNFIRGRFIQLRARGESGGTPSFGLATIRLTR